MISRLNSRLNAHMTLLLTALAPAIWGSSYIVITEMLPPDRPLTLALLRALPAAILLLLIVRQLPRGRWIFRVLVLGALNFSIFWALMNVGAYRLPGGVAATLGAMQPLIVLVLARFLLNGRLTFLAVLAGVAGVIGVGMLMLKPTAALDPIGLLAAGAAAVSMALGTVMTRYWKPEVSPLTLTAWQLAAGALLLAPAALLTEPVLPPLTGWNIAGFAYMTFIGAGLTYMLWFRGIGLLGPSAIAPLGLLSPLMAVILGWAILDQTLSAVQIAGMVLVLGSVLVGQHAGQLAQRRPVSRPEGTPANEPG